MTNLINVDNLCDFFYSEESGTDEFINELIMNYSELDMNYHDDCVSLCDDLIEGIINIIKTEQIIFDLDVVIDKLQKLKLYSAIEVIKNEIDNNKENITGVSSNE